jgi:putative tryptophan/tyrosine transport system substrate-binding protein
MRRREFVTLIGGAAATWPLATRAQQATVPAIAYLSGRSAESEASMLVAFRRGLNAAGYIEGQNLAIEYRFADGQYDRLPTMLAELTRRQPAVIIFVGLTAGIVERMSQTLRDLPIPIVFNAGFDPVRTGLVASINRPGGNLTGVFSLVGELTGKHFERLHEIVPKATTIGVLRNPVSFSGTRLAELQGDATEAAARLGLRLRIINADTNDELEHVFTTLSRQQIEALMVQPSPFFVTRARLITRLAADYRLPAIYARREFADAGGLMSYGYDIADSYRQKGIYAGRILTGEKPAELPVIMPTKFEFVINLNTAKALGLVVPPTLLALADEVIE